MDTKGRSMEDETSIGDRLLPPVDLETKRLIIDQQDAIAFIEEKKTHTNDMVSVSKLNDIKAQMLSEDNDMTPAQAKAEAEKLSMI